MPSTRSLCASQPAAGLLGHLGGRTARPPPKPLSPPGLPRSCRAQVLHSTGFPPPLRTPGSVRQMMEGSEHQHRVERHLRLDDLPRVTDEGRRAVDRRVSRSATRRPALFASASAGLAARSWSPATGWWRPAASSSATSSSEYPSRCAALITAARSPDREPDVAPIFEHVLQSREVCFHLFRTRPTHPSAGTGERHPWRDKPPNLRMARTVLVVPHARGAARARWGAGGRSAAYAGLWGLLSGRRSERL